MSGHSRRNSHAATDQIGSLGSWTTPACHRTVSERHEASDLSGSPELGQKLGLGGFPEFLGASALRGGGRAPGPKGALDGFVVPSAALPPCRPAALPQELQSIGRLEAASARQRPQSAVAIIEPKKKQPSAAGCRHADELDSACALSSDS